MPDSIVPRRCDFSPILLGNMVKAKRERHGFSLRDARNEIVNATGHDVSAATLSRIESDSAPDIDTLCVLVEWLGVPIGKFFGEQTHEEASSTTAERVSRILAEDTSITPNVRQSILEFVTLAVQRCPEQRVRNAAADLHNRIHEQLDGYSVALVSPEMDALRSALGDSELADSERLRAEIEGMTREEVQEYLRNADIDPSRLGERMDLMLVKLGYKSSYAALSPSPAPAEEADHD